jgi:hypothetical protein
MENQLTKVTEETKPSIFSSLESFDHWQRVAKMMSSSSIVPKNYVNNVANTMIALELANRIGISPFMVMQNLDIIQGKPSWNSTFIIAALNSCGRFKPMKFKFEGEGDNYGCYAYTYDDSGELLKGTKITTKMVQAEGWLNKSGSKWKTMPEQMFQYRAASFFGRVYAPDILNGMHSVEEVKDFVKKNPSENNADLKRQIEENLIENEYVWKDKEELDLINDALDNEKSEKYSAILDIMESRLITRSEVE